MKMYTLYVVLTIYTWCINIYTYLSVYKIVLLIYIHIIRILFIVENQSAQNESLHEGNNYIMQT